MRSTGIVRKVDELGRVVLPIELRRPNINEKEPVEIFVDEKIVILQKNKNEAVCVITGDIYSQNQLLETENCFGSLKELKTYFENSMRLLANLANPCRTQKRLHFR